MTNIPQPPGMPGGTPEGMPQLPIPMPPIPGASPGGTGSAVTGMAQDGVKAVKAASEGDAAKAVDAGLDTAATGAAMYFGGEPAAQVTSAVMKSEVGTAGKKGLIALVGVVVLAVVMSLMSAGAGAVGIVASLAGASTTAACFPLGGDSYSGEDGGLWAMKFLYAQGLRGDPLRVMWSIVMRESSGDPTNRTPESGTYENGTFDAGLFQTNSTNADSLAEYGLTMDDAFNPDLAFNFWMRRASPNGKLMSSLIMWGLNSWSDPTLNATQYSRWTPQQHQEWIVEPFERYMRQVDDAARQANINIGSSVESKVVLSPLGPARGVMLTVLGAGAARSGERTVPVSTGGSAASITNVSFSASSDSNQGFVIANTVPESLQTVSGHEVLKPGDERLVTFEVANRKVTFHRDFQQLFTDFLNAWDRDPVLGQDRLNISKGEGPVDSYSYRQARRSPKWSDHGGYAVDIRYDLLPAFSGYQMTRPERKATRRLLKQFPEIGWGGDYDMKNMDEMHFYVRPGVTAPGPRWSPGCAEGGIGGPIAVSPGPTLLPGPDAEAPYYGYSVNLEGGRNMVYYNQCDGRWPSDQYDWCGAACGTTAMAMIVATLAQRPEITPVDMLPIQRAKGGIPGGGGTVNMPTVFPAMAKEFNIEGKYIGTDWNAVRDTLKRGGLVAASITTGSAFWSSGPHYVVIRGMNRDGTKFYIADPGRLTNSIAPGFTTNQFVFNIGMSAFLPSGQKF